MALMILLLGTVIAVVKASNHGLPGAQLTTRAREPTDVYDDQDVVAAVPAGADGSPFVATLPVSDDNPQYSYSYGLRKSMNGATKSQHEARNGGIVEGNYNILDPEGIVRTVNFAMDSSNGYKAIMHKKSPVMTMMASHMIDRIPIPWAVSGYPFPKYPFNPTYVPNFPFCHLLWDSVNQFRKEIYRD